MIQKKMLFAVIGLSAFSLFAAARKPMDVPVDTVEKLVEAIGNAVSGDRILLAPKTYDLTGVRMSKEGDSGYAHLLVSTKCTIAGTGSRRDDTILKGAGNTDCEAGFPLKVLYVSAAGTVISNLTITGGYDTKSKKFGGGVTYANGGNLVVDCIISNNYTTSSGGGLGGKYSTVHTVDRVSAIRCLFVGNGADGCGGAMTCRGSYTLDCVFSNNWTKSSGGAVMSGSHFGSKFYDNWCYSQTAGQGGGAVGRDYVNDAFIYHGSCVDCVFVGNGYTNKAVTGAAIYRATAVSNCFFAANHCETSNAMIAGVPIVSHCTFADHVDVPVMMRCSDVPVEVDSCVFTNNAVGTDGFFYCDPLVVRNSLFVNNQISGHYCRSGDCDFQNCTFVGNTGATTFLSSDCSAVNCVFAGNSPYEIPESASYIPYMTNCLWTSQVKTNDTMTTRLAAKCSGTSRLVADVKFKDPANGDYSPKGIRSPLYNAGYEDDAYLAALGKTDCAGGERRKFDKIDIGAFEMQEKQGLTVIFR